MKKAIAIFLTCILMLSIAVVPALAASVSVEIPSDVAGIMEKYYESHVKTSANVHAYAILDTDSYGGTAADTLEAGNVYYAQIWLEPVNGYEIPKFPNLFNVKIKAGKGVTVTCIKAEGDSILIRAKILVDGGSASERIKNLFQSFFGRIAYLFNEMVQRFKSIGNK